MLKEKEYPTFVSLGNDIKKSRQVLSMSRKELAEMVHIDPRYLANIENSGSLPSLPVFYELVKICKLPVEQYFFPKSEEQDSKERKRANLKLSLCPEQYLPVIEGAIDGALKTSESRKVL